MALKTSPVLGVLCVLGFGLGACGGGGQPAADAAREVAPTDGPYDERLSDVVAEVPPAELPPDADPPDVPPAADAPADAGRDVFVPPPDGTAPPGDAVHDGAPDGSVSDAPAGDAAGDSDVPPGPPPGTRVRYDLAVTPRALPYPYDFYTVPDAASPTAQRVSADAADHSNALVDGVFRFLPRYRDLLLSLDGFGPYGWISAELVGAAPLDYHLSPADGPPEAAPVRLHLWDGHTLGAAVPITAEVATFSDRAHHEYATLDLLPVTPLPDGARALVVVTRDFLDATGASVLPDEHFRIVAGLEPVPAEADPALRARLAAEAERLGPAFAALAAAGTAPDRLAVAFDFTVAHARAELLALGARFRDEPDFGRVAYTLDPDGDGLPDAVSPGAPGFPGRLTPAHTALFLRGQFERRDFRDPTRLEGTFRPGADGVPEQVAAEPVDFWLVLPAAPLGGVAPVTLLVHGVDASSGQMLGVADTLAAVGIASLGFDLPEHGQNGSGGAAFLRIDAPGALRDNFRQAGIDVVTALHLIRALAADGLDLVPAGGDGRPDLDAKRIGYVGNSLGTMVGMIGAALDEAPGAAVFGVGGAGLVHFVYAFLEQYGLTAVLDGTVVHAVKVLAGHVFAAGDPVLYAPYYRPAGSPWAGPAREALLVQAGEDIVMPHACLRTAAIALDVPLLGPVAVEAPGVRLAGAGPRPSALVQYPGVSHDILVARGANPEALEAALQAQLQHYLHGYFRSGRPEILHPFPNGPTPGRAP